MGEEVTVDKGPGDVKVESSEEENVENYEESVDKDVNSEESAEEEPEDEPEEESEDDEYDYVSMTKAELVELAKKRGLAVSGTKKKLISRLESND